MKYVCNVKCWVAGKKKAMFMPGDIVDFDEDEIVPGHFTCIEPKEEPKEEPVSIEIEVKKLHEQKLRHLRKPKVSEE